MQKRTYVANETIITADNLNEIQDTINENSNKQDKLINEQNIRSINDYSLVGSGKITLPYNLTITKTTSTDEVTTYTFKQGDTILTPSITIPRDLVISSGSIVTVSGEKYLRLILTSGDKIDIKVSELCDVYTADTDGSINITDYKIKVSDTFKNSKEDKGKLTIDNTTYDLVVSTVDSGSSGKLTFVVDP